MSWIILIIVGGVIGWLASLIMRTNNQQGIWLDVLIGIIGALLGKFIFFNLLGIGSAASAGAFNFYGFLWGIVGAIILIAILRAFKVFY